MLNEGFQQNEKQDYSSTVDNEKLLTVCLSDGVIEQHYVENLSQMQGEQTQLIN